jgi:Immunity protein Imm6
MNTKIIELQKLFKSITMRGQAAFLLTVAEMIVSEIESDHHGMFLAKSAIDDSWEWSEALTISGDKLYGYVDNEDEEKDLGIRELYYQQQTSPIMIAAVIAITCIVGYVARLAYIVEGKTSFPVCIEIIDQDFIDCILENACKTTAFDLNKAYELMTYLSNNYPSNNSEQELGSVIARDELEIRRVGTAHG